ncbi:unnamed protein product [Soboliphyme baturini]|uniref:ZP domain-containing protein n=1 Tax=Soboliphyme baturini TaxID=241478 RepID=A0A183IFV7_9BILA|nr:unnamed protein product [Soboliphyme baturini]
MLNAGVPKVACEDDEVTIVFETKQPFTGRIFVKGMSNKSECSTTYRSNAVNSVHYRLRNGQCNMLRQRRVGPQRGVEHSMTVVVSFHGTFITKTDKAYRCTCFFMEADNVVKSGIEVGSLATTDLIDTARIPSCSYRIKQNSINGPGVRSAEVGDRVYHVWQCDSDLFGMLVHSCFVDDESGENKYTLLDEDGCAIDELLIAELTYNDLNNEAFVDSNVFKFADKPELYFQCSITLCSKSDGSCVGLTPPRCDKNRPRRTKTNKTLVQTSKKSKRHTTDLDLSSDKLLVFDISDDFERTPKGSKNICFWNFFQQF